MQKRLLILGAFLCAALLAAFALRKPPAPFHPWFAQFDSYPLVIAHADDTGQGLWPGNTMVFLEGVADTGVDVLEMDTHMTHDGHIVLLHDDRVDRTTNGQGTITEMTIEEVKALEVAGDWSPDEGITFPYRGSHLQVPTLEEVFQRFPEYPMVIEIKQETPSMANAMCNLIREYGMGERVLIPSFSDKAIKEFREVCPEVATAASSDEVRNFVIANYLYSAPLLSPAYVAFQVPVKSGGIPVVIPHFVRNARARNLQVHVWTINDEAEMKELINMGVDGIMTDRPDMLLAILGRS
ncbi:MAG: glycerophosphodiester phosphodiesterase [Candidatus Promineifilaceae bacterium]